MNATWPHRDNGFVIGLLTGAPNSLSTLSLVSVRRSTNPSAGPKAVETTLP
jgi:hypothetical protein